MSDSTLIKTERILLRRFEPNDIDNVFKGLSDPIIIKHYGISFETLEATKEQMLWYEELEKNETGMWFALCSLDNKTFYGAAGLNGRNKQHKKAEIGFWLMKEFWGQGIIKEVIPIVCEYGFTKLDLHRIEAFVESDNTNSKNVMAKSSFQFEGTMKDCEIKNNKFISLDIYALLKK